MPWAYGYGSIEILFVIIIIIIIIINFYSEIFHLIKLQIVMLPFRRPYESLKFSRKEAVKVDPKINNFLEVHVQVVRKPSIKSRFPWRLHVLVGTYLWLVFYFILYRNII